MIKQRNTSAPSLGEKLKQLRLYRSMTQEQLAGDSLTRNMLSLIERGRATPSYTTLAYLADILSVDPSYFFPKGPDLQDVIENDVLLSLIEPFKNKQFSFCLSLAEGLGSISSFQLSYILSESAFEMGAASFNCSKFEEAESYFRLCEQYSAALYKNIYGNKIAFYRIMIQYLNGSFNFHASALLSLSSSDKDFSDLVSYFYVTVLLNSGQIDFASRFFDASDIRNTNYRIHISARLSAAGYNYLRGKELLRQIIDTDMALPYPFLYNVYSDLERYCKATDDYEGAYRCAVEKLKYRYTD